MFFGLVKYPLVRALQLIFDKVNVVLEIVAQSGCVCIRAPHTASPISSQSAIITFSLTPYLNVYSTSSYRTDMQSS